MKSEGLADAVCNPAFLLSLIVLLSSLPLSLSWTWGHLGRSCSSYCNTQIPHLLLMQRFAAWGSSPLSAAVSCSASTHRRQVLQMQRYNTPGGALPQGGSSCMSASFAHINILFFCPLTVKCARFLNLTHRLSDIDVLGWWLPNIWQMGSDNHFNLFHIQKCLCDTFQWNFKYI